MNKIKNLSMKNKILLILILLIELLLVGGTLAWLVYESDNNALVNAKVCAPEIVFLGGSTINGSGLRPVADKENGLSKDISVNLENLCDNDTATMDLYLDLEVFPTELAEESLVWKLYKVTTENETEVLTLLNNGNFEGKVQGDTIELTDDTEIVTGNISNYRLYIYLDGSQDNSSTMGNKFFKFDLYGEGRDAIYKADTIKNITMASGTTYFLVDNEELLKDNIGSIEIRAFNNIPGTATEIDDNGVLSNDDTVKIFYEKNPETNLNKVYIGTSNGILKMNTKMDYMFAGLTKVESLDLSRLDTSNVTSMIGVFYNSPSLININMSTWDTSEVTKMNTMFQGTSGLTSLDVSNFDTSKVTTMASMFRNAGISSLSLDLSNFNTPLVTTMANMFSGCKASSINVSNFSNDKVTNMEQMFQDCKATNINLSNFKTPKITKMGGGSWLGMFQRCTNLIELDLSSFDVSKVTDMGYMFYNCTSLKRVNLNGWNTELLTNMTAMFQGCTSIKEIDLSSFRLNNTSLNSTFLQCNELENIIFNTSNTQKVTNLNETFEGCSKLKNINLTSFDTSSVTNMAKTFSGCSSLESLDLSSFNTENVTSMREMFYNCSKLLSLDLSSFITPELQIMNEMFKGCSSLTTLDVSNFNTSKVTSMCTGGSWQGLFNGCSSLTELDLSSFDISKLSNINYMFYGCSKLKKIDIRNFVFTSSLGVNGINILSDAEIIVKDCEQYNLFKTKIGARSGLHTVSGDYTCSV